MITDEMPHQTKASDNEIVESYRKTGSVWKTARLFGMCGQSVHDRLVRLKANNPPHVYSGEIRKMILAHYKTGFQKETLAQFCNRNGLLIPNVCRWAGQRGLTNPRRRRSNDTREAMSIRATRWLQTHPHPRGFLGGKHNAATRAVIAKKSSESWKAMTRSNKSNRQRKIIETRIKKYGSASPHRSGTTWKSSWRTIGGQRKFFRSSWEANYARYLEYRKTCGIISKWEHEPITFFFPGVLSGPVSYLPDFKVTTPDGGVEYHEVKGWIDRSSKLKMRRMRKYHPRVKLVVRSSKWFKRWNSSLKEIIPDWEQTKRKQYRITINELAP
jgi:hypothetical protein